MHIFFERRNSKVASHPLLTLVFCYNLTTPAHIFHVLLANLQSISKEKVGNKTPANTKQWNNVPPRKGI